MVCKNCKRDIDDDSIFCKWCGEKQIRERRKKGEVKVPKPRQLADGRWFAQVMIDGERHNAYGNTIAEYETNARALKQGLMLDFAGLPKKRLIFVPTFIVGFACVFCRGYPLAVIRRIASVAIYAVNC